MAVKRELPSWENPIDPTRKGEVVACAKEVIDSLWPALKDAYMQEVLESCVQRCDAARSAATTSYVCTQTTVIRASSEQHAARKGKLRKGEKVDVVEERGGSLRFAGGWVGAEHMEKQAAELAPEPEQSFAPMVGVPAVGGMALDLQTPSNVPVSPAGGFDLMGGGAPTAAPAVGGGGFDLLGGQPAPAPPPPAGGGFGLMGATSAPAVPAAGGFDLLGGAAPAPAATGGFDLLGGAVAAPPVAAADPFAAMMGASPQTPAVAPPDPFGMVAAPAAAPADPFGMAAATPAPAVSGGVDFLGGLTGGAPAAAAVTDDLPPGWVKKESKQYAGRFFYYHTATNTTTWEKPTAASTPAAAPAPAAAAAAASPKSAKKGKGMGGMMGKAKAAKAAMEQAALAAAAVGVKEAPKAEQPLPAGWEKKESGQYPGKFFYYNAATKETTWERPAPPVAAVPAATAAPAGDDLLGMFGAPAPAPAPPPPVNTLGLPPSASAPQPGNAAARPGSVTATTAAADGAVLPSRSGTVRKETGVRHIWQQRYLKLAAGILSWSKYETDTVDRGSLALDNTWCVGADELARSGCSPADVDGTGAYVRVGSSANGKDGGAFVFMVHKKNDHQNRLYFDAGTDEAREQWIADIQATIDAAPKASPKAKEAEAEELLSAKKAGKFMKGMRKQMQAAAMSGIGAGGDAGAADFADDEEPVFAIACPQRSGLLQKESTGMRHQWEPRLFVLSNAGQLHYYKPGAETDDPQGRIPLGPRWRVAPSWQEERPFSIKVWDGITEATQSARGQAYFLQAETEEDQLGWVEDIQTAIFAMRFGEMDAEEVLLQRAMMRVYKKQKDAHFLPYEEMAIAEYALDELCYARALDGLSGFIDYYLKSVPADAQTQAREAVQHAVLAIVESECDKAWQSWERETVTLHQQAEASLLMHPATMDALLQHETNAQAQLENALQGPLSTLCTKEIAPGVQRVLRAQLLPFSRLVKSMLPQAITVQAMLSQVVECGASPSESSLQALLDATTKALESWLESISSSSSSSSSNSSGGGGSGTAAAAAAAAGAEGIVGLLEQDVFPCVGKSLLAMLSCLNPMILSTGVVEGITGLDELEDELSTLLDPSAANDLCADAEDDIGKRFICEARRVGGLAMLRQQQAMSSAHPDLTVTLSWGLNTALLQCVAEAASAFFHAMQDSLETDNVDTNAPPICGAGYMHAVRHMTAVDQC